MEEFLRNRHAAEASMEMDDESQSEACSRLNKGYGGAARSQKIRSMHDDPVNFHIHNIERRLNKANEKRQEQMSHQLQK